MVDSMRTRFGLAITVLWLANPAQCLADGPKIWDRPIMAQPFDAGTFREVKIPEWVQQTVGCGYTLSAMGSEARRARRLTA